MSDGEFLRIGGEWLALIRAVDAPVMLGIAIVCFILFRRPSVDNIWAHVTPWVMGAAYGGILTYEAGEATVAYLIKGVLLNGGASWLVAWASHAALSAYLKKFK